MRVDSLIPLTAKAEYWDYEKVQADSGEVTQVYFKSADIKLMLTENQGVPVMFARERLRWNGQLRNLVDHSGNPIFDEAIGKFIFMGTPVAQFDVYGNVMGYKYTLTQANVGSAVSMGTV